MNLLSMSLDYENVFYVRQEHLNGTVGNVSVVCWNLGVL